jgi:paxillin
MKSKDRPLPSPTYMSEGQKGQPKPSSYMSPSTLASHAPPSPSKLRECFTSESADLPEGGTASYLKDLRSHRTSRPSGSRPPPPSKFGSLRRTGTVPIDQHVSDDRPRLEKSDSMPIMAVPRLTHRRAESDLRSPSPFAGRPLARPPSAAPPEMSSRFEPSKELKRPTSMAYMENGMRWMETQEARSLRKALEDMDLVEEKKIHSAAQDEAAELVWQHQHPEAAKSAEEAPFANPDLRKDYKSHLRRGSYQRSHSQEQMVLAESRGSSRAGRPSLDMPTISKRDSMDTTRKVSPPTATMAVRKTRTPSGKCYAALASSVADDVAQAHRRTSSSGSSKRIMSGEKKMYMHPNDKIWEDPQERETSVDRPSTSAPPAALPPATLPPQRPQPLPPPAEAPAKPAITPVQPPQQPTFVRKNPFARVRMQQEKLTHSASAPVLPVAKLDRVEIQRNPPTQSRNPFYTSNASLPPTPPSSRGTECTDADEVAPKGTPPTKDGKEIRSDDIRAATSKQRKDRSPNLPQPTVVSDKPGRPIVSFQRDWKREVVLEEVHAPPAGPEREPSKVSVAGPSRSRFERRPSDIPTINMPPETSGNGARPPIPTINLPDEPSSVPTIVLPEEPDFAGPGAQSAPITPSINIDPPSMPAINISVPDDTPAPSTKPARRPLPAPSSSSSSRPPPRHSATFPLQKSTPHYTPSIRQSGILCAHCALPIAGRILGAAGERFHPDCFVCHECHTNLELVAFYPEPDNKRSERLARIHARQAGKEIASEIDERILADGDPSLRFYCHLDYHELFSPRCKSCKTPIEGEVIVACGAEWHQGHFFCAQCGDPFDATTPFVEKDGYAWCVGCHTNRYSPKCRGCRKPVTDVVVKALGADWHGGCFRCVVSGS